MAPEKSTLSDKLKEHGRGPFVGKYLKQEQVREFIKQLKGKYDAMLEKIANTDDIDELHETLSAFPLEINELAGKELCDE